MNFDSVVEGQGAASVYFIRRQILQFGTAEQNSLVQIDTAYITVWDITISSICVY